MHFPEDIRCPKREQCSNYIPYGIGGLGRVRGCITWMVIGMRCGCKQKQRNADQ